MSERRPTLPWSMICIIAATALFLVAAISKNEPQWVIPAGLVAFTLAHI